MVPPAIGLALDRARLFAFCGLIDLCNAFSTTLFESLHAYHFETALLRLGGVSAVIWFAGYAIFAIARQPGTQEPVVRRDCAVCATMLVAAAIPDAHAASLAVLVGGVHLVATSTHGDRSRRIGTVLLALTGPLIWGRVLLQFLAPELLAAEAHIVAAIIGVPVVGNLVQFAGSTDKFYIETGCSSLHNMSLAVVLWAAVTQALALRINWPLVFVAVSAAFGMLVVNLVRIILIGLYRPSFTMLHEGIGADAFGWGSLLAGALIVFLGVDVAQRVRR